MKPITHKAALGLLAAMALFPVASWSQTVPTELLELSIEDLFDTNIIDDQGQSSDQSKWHLELAFTSSAYDEYYINGSKVTKYNIKMFTIIIKVFSNVCFYIKQILNITLICS